MRPKRRILVMTADESEASRWSFLLETRGNFIVAKTSNTNDALIEAAGNRFELLIARFDIRTCPRFTHAIKEISKEIFICVVAEEYVEAGHLLLEGMLIKPTPIELLECAKVLTSRKRGPRKAEARLGANQESYCKKPETVIAGVA